MSYPSIIRSDSILYTLNKINEPMENIPKSLGDVPKKYTLDDDQYFILKEKRTLLIGSFLALKTNFSPYSA